MNPTTNTWQPTREVEIIVGTPPGGGQDRPARVLTKVMASAGIVNVPMRVSNVVGKGGGSAWDALRTHGGDPHVLSINSGPLLANRILGVSDYDQSAFTPLANLYTENLVFIVPAASPIKDAQAFLARLKSSLVDPIDFVISFATAIGSTNHIALGQIMTHLAGEPQALNLRVFDSALYAVADVAEGKSDAGVISAVSAVKAMQAGTVRALAVTAATRMGGVFASTPTWAEQDVPCVLGQWRGIMGGMGGKGMNAEQVQFWEQAFSAATRHADWRAELETNYWTHAFMGATQAREFLDGEYAFLDKMLHGLGLAT